MSPKSRRQSRDEDAAGGPAGRRSLRPLLALKPYLMAYPWVLAGGGLALVTSAMAMLVLPLAVRRMIDNGFGASDGQFIDRYFMMMIVIGAVVATAAAFRVYFVNWIGERVVADLRRDVFAHLATLGPSFYEVTHSGEVMSRLTADTTQLKSAAGSTVSQALRNSIMLIGALVMMFVTSAWLSALVLIVIPAVVLPLMAYGRSVQKLTRRAQDTLAEASAYAAENLQAVRTMQAFRHEGAVTGRFAAAVERAFEAARDRLKARSALTAVAMFVVFASIIGVLWIGASSVVKGTMTGGTLSQFVLYAVFAGGALAELAEVWGEVSQAAGAAERLVELKTVVPEIRSPERPRPLPEPPRGEIAFEAVTFRYPSRPQASALDKVSFRILPGETVALVGPSGAGKSTIFNLLLRFYDPVSGVVRLDGVPVAEAALDELRKRIAVVPQEVALFADTVAENIRYGTPGATDEEVRRAAAAAQAEEFISSLPEGFATRLGERGVTLSGGQRQRIAIARAILKDAPVLLLDEATSALDAENETLVQRALSKVMEGRTTLVIAHRLATVQMADSILVFDEGQIVAEGTHAELVAKGGLYKRLAELQFGRDSEQVAAE